MSTPTNNPCPYVEAYRAGGDAFTPPGPGETLPSMPEHPYLDSPDVDIRDNFKDGWNDARCDHVTYSGGGFRDRR